LEHDDVASYRTRAEAVAASSQPERWCEVCWANLADTAIPNPRGRPVELRVFTGPLLTIDELIREERVRAMSEHQLSLPATITPAEEDEVEFVSPRVPGRMQRKAFDADQRGERIALWRTP
jgi:hypothetical protein